MCTSLSKNRSLGHEISYSLPYKLNLNTLWNCMVLELEKLFEFNSMCNGSDENTTSRILATVAKSRAPDQRKKRFCEFVNNLIDISLAKQKINY